MAVRGLIEALTEWFSARSASLMESRPWVAVVIGAGLLLTSVSVSLWLRRRAKRRSERPPSEASELPDPIELEREALRGRHRVRPLKRFEETLGLNRLPGGVYGFSFLPLSPDCPVLGNQEARLFEVHKTSDGVVWILGFVDRESAARMEAGREPVDASVYAGPVEDACVLVSIPLPAVARCRQRLSQEMNALELTLQPAREWEHRAESRWPDSETERGMQARRSGAG